MENSLKAKIKAVLAGADVVKRKKSEDDEDVYDDSDSEIDELEENEKEEKSDAMGKPSEDADYAVMKMLLNSKIKQKLNDMKGKKNAN